MTIDRRQISVALVAKELVMMSKVERFGIGGLGGLLPILATLVGVDLASIANLIDNHQITEGLCVGLTIRVTGLFVLGGVMAALNGEVNSQLSLVQIGIAAPALVTSFISGVALNKAQNVNTKTSFIVSTASAANLDVRSDTLLAGGFLSDVLQGITPGLGVGNAGKQVDSPDLTVSPNPPVHICAGEGESGPDCRSWGSIHLSCDEYSAIGGGGEGTAKALAKRACTYVSNGTSTVLPFNLVHNASEPGGKCGWTTFTITCGIAK